MTQWQHRQFSDAEWAALLRENARQLRGMSEKVQDPRASRLLFLQGEIADRSADRIDMLLREREMTP
jgi:hypothetical protein